MSGYQPDLQNRDSFAQEYTGSFPALRRFPQCARRFCGTPCRVRVASAGHALPLSSLSRHCFAGIHLRPFHSQLHPGYCCPCLHWRSGAQELSFSTAARHTAAPGGYLQRGCRWILVLQPRRLGLLRWSRWRGLRRLISSRLRRRRRRPDRLCRLVGSAKSQGQPRHLRPPAPSQRV